MKKRKRKARPRTLLIFGVGFILLPFVNYFIIAKDLNIHYSLPEFVFAKLNPAAAVLLLAPFVIGVGLLMVKRWAWRLFLVYALVVVAYDLAILLTAPVVYNARMLLQTLFGLAAVMYFTQPDISAPYMKMYPRGWRMQKRRPVVLDAVIDGVKRKTRDFGSRGLFADWPDCPHEPNDAVTVEFELDGRQFCLEAGIVRID
ncbi:MAG: hypothetical protein IIB12_01770, partial [Chloroflexi bacterium]|nr:hypothetical protein [Chloroflexota bacterium]